jgi:LAGLIDADG DNA endonuclease family protein
MTNINKQLLIGISPNSRLFKEYKNSLKSLNQIQWETSIGLMLGDASIQTQNQGKTHRLKFEWSDKNKAYIDHVYNLFDEWVISPPHNKSRISPKGNLVVNWGFQTISHEAFNPLAELFKDWLIDAFSINSTDVQSIGENAIINWKNNLDSIQSVDLHDSGTPLSSPVEVTSELDKLLDPIDSASNISEVVSNVSTIYTTDVVDNSYIELFGNVVEIVTSEAAIQASNVALIQAATP